jgi:hypothetical protein
LLCFAIKKEGRKKFMMKKIKAYFFVSDDEVDFTISDIIAICFLILIVIIGISVNLAVWL